MTRAEWYLRCIHCSERQNSLQCGHCDRCRTRYLVNCDDEICILYKKSLAFIDKVLEKSISAAYVDSNKYTELHYFIYTAPDLGRLKACALDILVRHIILDDVIACNKVYYILKDGLVLARLKEMHYSHADIVKIFELAIRKARIFSPNVLEWISKIKTQK